VITATLTILGPLAAVVLISLPSRTANAVERRTFRADIAELPIVILAGLGFAGFFIGIDRAAAEGALWWPLTIVRVFGITLVALAFLAAIAAAALLGSTLGRHGIVLVVVFALITFGYGRTRDIADGGKNVWAGGRVVREVVDDDIVPDGSVVRYRLVSDSEQPDANRSRQRQRFMLYQFYLPELRFEIDDGGPEDVSPFVFAPTNTQSLIDEGGTIVWRDPSAGIGLWALPGSPG